MDKFLTSEQVVVKNPFYLCTAAQKTKTGLHARKREEPAELTKTNLLAYEKFLGYFFSCLSLPLSLLLVGIS